MSLFIDPSRVRADAKQLLNALDVVLGDSDRAEMAAWALHDELAGSLSSAVEETRSGRLPIDAFVVLAGAIALTRAKDYACGPIWASAMRLREPHAVGTEPEILTKEDLKEIARKKRTHGAAVAATMRDGLVARKRIKRARQWMVQQRTTRRLEDAIARLSQGAPPERLAEIRERVQSEFSASGLLDAVPGDPTPFEATPAPAEHVAGADRVAPLGAGGQRRSELAAARASLWFNRATGPAWEGLCAAFDVIGAGSQDGLRRLRVVTDAHPDSPSLLWLDEFACRIARESRARSRAAALDAVLASGRFGSGAARLCFVVEMGRKMLAEKPAAAHDAWLALAAAPRASSRMEHDDEPEPLSQTRARRRAAARGDEKAIFVELLEDTMKELRAGIAADEENQGPFYGLETVFTQHERMLDGIAHYTVMAFRPLYALEILHGRERESLREWVGG